MKRQIFFAVMIMVLCSVSIWAQNEINVTVIAKQANLREKPNARSKVIRSIDKDTKFIVNADKKVGDWVEVYDLKTKRFGWLAVSVCKITKVMRRVNVTATLGGGDYERKEAYYSEIAKGEWIQTGASEKRTMYYSPKIEKIGGKLYFWSKKVNFISENAVKYSLDYQEADCKGMAVRLLKIAYFEADDSFIYSRESSDQLMTAVTPGSIGEGLLKAVCKIANSD